MTGEARFGFVVAAGFLIVGMVVFSTISVEEFKLKAILSAMPGCLVLEGSFMENVPRHLTGVRAGCQNEDCVACQGCACIWFHASNTMSTSV